MNVQEPFEWGTACPLRLHPDIKGQINAEVWERALGPVQWVPFVGPVLAETYRSLEVTKSIGLKVPDLGSEIARLKNILFSQKSGLVETWRIKLTKNGLMTGEILDSYFDSLELNLNNLIDAKIGPVKQSVVIISIPLFFLTLVVCFMVFYYR